MAGNRLSWTIKESSKLNRAKGASVESPIFPEVQGDLRVDWQLILYPGGAGVGTKDDSFDYRGHDHAMPSLYLKMVRCNYSAIAAKFRIWSQPPSGSEQLVRDRTERAHFSVGGKCRRWGWLDAKLQGFMGDYLEDDTVRILCQVYSLDVEGEPLEHFTVDSRPFNRLWPFYEQGKFTDFAIVVGTEEFLVHKVLVAAHSPVIAAMFDHDTKENATNRLEISDFDAETVRTFVKFIYTGPALDLGDKAAELLAFADKYEVNPLKTECEVTLVRNIDTQNVTTLLELADIHGAKFLKKYSLQFMKDNIKDVMENNSVMWKSLSRSLLEDFIRSLFPEEFETKL